MKKSFLLSCAAVAAVLAVASCTRSATDLPPGHYESRNESTNSAGTTTETNRSTDVSMDEYGNKTAVVKNKTTKDPKGLFNKRTVNESESVVRE